MTVRVFKMTIRQIDYVRGWDYHSVSENILVMAEKAVRCLYLKLKLLPTNKFMDGWNTFVLRYQVSSLYPISISIAPEAVVLFEIGETRLNYSPDAFDAFLVQALDIFRKRKRQCETV